MGVHQPDQPAAAPAAAAGPPTAQIVGNAFVHQYYHILHQSPDLVYRFYDEKSRLGRPDAGGLMRIVSSMQAINEKILSLDYCDYTGDILTVDSQDSFERGVIVLVTGNMCHKDGGKRKFTQSFFLAPQDNGYYVLNDMFRYVDESYPVQGNQETADGAGAAPVAPEQVVPAVQEQQISEEPEPTVEDEETTVAEVYNPSDDEEGSVVDEELPVNEVVVHVPNGTKAAADSSYVAAAAAAVHEETPKKSYASIVKVMKENVSPVSSPVQAVGKQVHVKQERQPVPQTAPLVPETVVSATSDNGNVQEAEADGCSIYIKNLPMNATPAQLEEEFKRFGPIRIDGIQVRSHKQHGFCFGFVEFEVAASVQSAIEASPITIGGRPAYVEEKRASGSRVNSRNRYPPGRGGGFRNDGNRGGHGNYNGGRGGYARGEFINRGEFGNRGNGRGESGNRVDRGYQRVDSGGPRVDSGGPRVDSGGPRVDSGGPRVDSGGPRVDSGGPRVDSGGPRVDSGGPRVDSGGRMNRPGGFVANTSKVAPRVSAPA